MKNGFIDWICKLTSIPRFTGSPLMEPQSGADHAYRVTMIALQIVDEYNESNPKVKINREEVVLKALFHDTEESVLGDIPSPVKYFNETFREAVREVEETAMKDIVLKEVSKKQKKEYFTLWKEAKKGLSGKIIKIADKLEGFIKINFEVRQGNSGLIPAYYETTKWFEENSELISQFTMAEKLVQRYRIKELDQRKPS